ncbi:MAG: Lrp/AsnC family transcriptional regulator, partial [Mycobacterium sp.]
MADRITELPGHLDDPPKDVRPADLDDVDRRILSLLHGDARITNN